MIGYQFFNIKISIGKASVTLILLFLFTIIVHSQAPKIEFKKIGKAQGLSNNSVECIFQDSRGFIWFGTKGGLNKFDGYKMDGFHTDAEKQRSLTDESVTCIFEDNQQNLWVGTLNGLNRLNPKKSIITQFKNVPNDKKSLSNNRITSILEDKEGAIWIGTGEGGLNRFNPKTNSFDIFTVANTPNLSSNNINYIYKDLQQNYWIGTSIGIQQFFPETETFKPLENLRRFTGIPPILSVNYINEDKIGNLLIGTHEQGLILYNRQWARATYYRHQESDPNSLSSDHIRCISVTNNGTVWIGTTNGGLSLFDPTLNKFYTYKNQADEPGSISQRSVSSVCEDNQGNLWIGTERGWANLITAGKPRFHHYQMLPNKNSLCYNDVRAFCEDKDGNIWIGTDGGGLDLFNRSTNSFTHFKHNPNDNTSLGANEVLSIIEDSEGQIWVGTWGGGISLYNKKQKNFKHYNNIIGDNKSLSSNNVQQIFEDSKKNIWVATYSGGLNLFDRNTNTFTKIMGSNSKEKDMPGYRIISLGEDRNGNIWIGTSDKGLYKLNTATNQFEHYFTDNEKSSTINTIFMDSKGNIWIGQKGLYKYNITSNSFSLVSTSIGLQKEFIKGITDDERGDLWISSNYGISKLNTKTNEIKKYNTADGLQGIDFEPNAALKTKDGAMLFGGLNGFNLFYPEDIVPNKFIPPVYITGFSLQNQRVYAGDKDEILADDISYTKKIHLNYKQSAFSFEFAALNYITSENNEFQYKLENWDATWINAGTEHKASYTNVSPGTYIFRVRASNNDGIWNDKGQSIKIIISPPFWQSWWFKTLIALLITSGGVYFYRVRRKIQLQKFEEQKKEELHQLRLQFFTNISHEFRTPLSLIIGPVEKLLKETHTEKDKQTYQVIQRNASRLLQLISELMDFRKAESGALRLQIMPANLPVFLEEISQEFSEIAGQKNIAFTINNELANNEIWYDRQIVEKIIINLLSNSFKYTSDNGKITLKVTGSLHRENPFFQNELIINSNHTPKKIIYFSVLDNGIGISKESIPHLFERYYRVSNESMGSGIGLAFVKSLTQLHKGSISVFSEKNMGTEIIIGIPCSREDYDKKEKLIINTESLVSLESLKPTDKGFQPGSTTNLINDNIAARKNYTILIADDNEELRIFLKDSIDNEFSILEAENGKEALGLSMETYPDIIISDIMMPVMDGYDFCKQIKNNAETSHIPFIMLTAKSGIESQLEGTAHGADYYFAKPINIDLLNLTLKNIITQKNKLREKYQQDYNADVKELVHTTKEKEFVEELIKIIEENLSEPEMDIEFLCVKIGMSRTKLFNKTKNITGQSISNFVRTVRLRKAAQLMAQKDMTILEVMLSVGIETQSYFTKAFKNEFGKTPTQFIKDLDSKSRS